MSKPTTLVEVSDGYAFNVDFVAKPRIIVTKTVELQERNTPDLLGDALPAISNFVLNHEIVDYNIEMNVGAYQSITSQHFHAKITMSADVFYTKFKESIEGYHGDKWWGKFSKQVFHETKNMISYSKEDKKKYHEALK